MLLGFPLAYWIARFAGRFRNVFLVLVIIPFLPSYLIRTYGWLVILQRTGLLNSLLGRMGLGDNHTFLNTHFAVILGLTYGFLPFMILPLYASIERMDKSLVEASMTSNHSRVSFFPGQSAHGIARVGGRVLSCHPAVGDRDWSCSAV